MVIDMDKKDDDFKIRKFGIRIIKEGNNPPRIEFIDNFDDKDMEIFNKEIEDTIREMHINMLKMFGIDPSRVINEIEKKEEEEFLEMPMFDVTREGNKLKIAVLLENEGNVDVKIEKNKLIIKGDKFRTISIPISQEFSNAKIIHKEIKNRILNIVIEA